MKTGVSPEVTARFMALRRLAGESDLVDQSPPVDTFRNELRKFYSYREEDKPIVLGALTYLESLISLTAEIMSAAPDSGISILEAFVRDYPGVPGSNLAGRWSNLTESCLALHKVSDSKSVQGMWESSKNIHLNFNEFLNGLLPFIVIGLRQAKGESVNLKIFKASYSEKLDTLSAYTGGLRGRASPLLALSDRRIRNAIAHGDIYFDQAASLINTESPKRENELSIK